MIKVLLVDDHQLVRAGLASLLGTAEDVIVVGQAGDGLVAVQQARELEPDVVLMDLSMAEMDGSAATARILAARPRTRIVILTAFADRPRLDLALAHGAVGSVLKDAPPAELIEAVRAAAGVRQAGSGRSRSTSPRAGRPSNWGRRSGR